MVYNYKVKDWLASEREAKKRQKLADEEREYQTATPERQAVINARRLLRASNPAPGYYRYGGGGQFVEVVRNGAGDLEDYELQDDPPVVLGKFWMPCVEAYLDKMPANGVLGIHDAFESGCITEFVRVHRLEVGVAELGVVQWGDQWVQAAQTVVPFLYWAAPGVLVHDFLPDWIAAGFQEKEPVFLAVNGMWMQMTIGTVQPHNIFVQGVGDGQLVPFTVARNAELPAAMFSTSLPPAGPAPLPSAAPHVPSMVPRVPSMVPQVPSVVSQVPSVVPQVPSVVPQVPTPLPPSLPSSLPSLPSPASDGAVDSSSTQPSSSSYFSASAPTPLSPATFYVGYAPACPHPRVDSAIGGSQDCCPAHSAMDWTPLPAEPSPSADPEPVFLESDFDKLFNWEMLEVEQGNEVHGF